MTSDNLGFVSPYLLRPLRTELEAARQVDITHKVKCSKCGFTFPAWAKLECPDDDCPLYDPIADPVLCSRCGQPLSADCEVDGCEDPECPRAK